MTRRLALALAVAVAGLAAVVVAIVLVAGGGDGGDPAAERSAAPARKAGAAVPVVPNLDECARAGAEPARDCYVEAFTALVRGQDDPRPAVAAISEAAWKEGAGLLSDCHGIMHTVGRTYAEEAGLELGSLMAKLPQSNDPGCSAGFAHGMVTAVAPDIDPARPGEAARVCGDSGTRYQEYSCVHGFGHAFMRVYGSKVDAALDLCTGLGPRAAPDCAQGAYHDYWFAMAGYDDAAPPEEAIRDPRALCADAPRAYVRPCWYRAWVENRPEAFAVATPEDLDALCFQLDGPAAGGVHHGRGGHRAGGPGGAARALRAAAGGRRRGRLRARDEGAEPPARAAVRARRPGGALRRVRGRSASAPPACAGWARRRRCSRTASSGGTAARSWRRRAPAASARRARPRWTRRWRRSASSPGSVSSGHADPRVP